MNLVDNDADSNRQDADVVTDADIPGADYFAEPRLENYAIEELERTLQQLTEDENYEEAARVNEILQRKRAERDHDKTANDNDRKPTPTPPHPDKQ